MPTISPTTLDVLEARMVSIIEAVVPRVEYQSDERWKHYVDVSSAPSRTRRFTLRWVMGPWVTGGYAGPNVVDVSSVLSVVTDYSGQHRRLQALVADDWYQLRDRLASLTADITSGLIQLVETRSPPTRVSDTPQGRAALSDQSAANSNTFQMALTYDVQHHQARG